MRGGVVMRTFVRRLSGLLLALAALSFAGMASAQTLYGVNPFNNNAGTPPGSFGLYNLNTTTGAITGGQVVTVPGRTITGLQGLTQDPTTGTVYAIARAAAVPGRLLITLNLATGAGIEVGNLGDSFSSITFRADGQMFGVTGDGATVPETLYLINKATAAKTLATPLGNGDDGEVIAFNPVDGLIYHWSGNGVSVFESIQATAPWAVTNIPIVGGVGGEVFGAVWDPSKNAFLVHNISSTMQTWAPNGTRSDVQAATIEDVRGMVLLAFPANVPTLSEWGMILASLMLAGLGVVLVRRRFAA